MSIWNSHFVLDVEADGQAPGLFNMISFGLVAVADQAQGFLGEVAPIVDHAGDPEARKVVGVSFETQKGYRDPEQVMRKANELCLQRFGISHTTIQTEQKGTCERDGCGMQNDNH